MMMKKVKFESLVLAILGVSILSSFLAGCKHDPQLIYSNEPIITYHCNSDTVYFQNDILPLLNSTCATTGCHDAQTAKHDVVLTDYNSVMQTGGINTGAPSESNIYKAISKSNDENMPPSPATPWTNGQKDMLYKWIAQGAVNNECNGDSSNCDTSNVNFNNDVLPVFQTYCLGCHNKNNPSGGIDLTNFDHLATIIENGSLLGSINFEPGYNAMPKNGNQMSYCERRKIAIWVNDTTLTPPNGGGGGNNNGILCDPDTTYFQNTVLPLIVTNCATTGCHSSASHQHGVILVDYASIMQYGEVVTGNPNNSKLYKVLFGGGDGGFRDDDIMPPPPKAPFTTEQKNSIKNWILQGAKNNFCDGNCDTTNVTFSGTISPTVQTYCLGCHTGSGAGGGVKLSNYSEIVASANSGKLLGSIRYDSGYSPMPKNGQKLSDCIIREFEIWIEDGTPNN